MNACITLKHKFALHFTKTGASKMCQIFEYDEVEPVVQNVYSLVSLNPLKWVKADLKLVYNYY